MPEPTPPRVRRASAWPLERIEPFLQSSRIPLRLACNAGSGFPLLGSLWFEYRDGCLWCATHQGSAIVRFLQADPRCAFEVAPNDPPYLGVRGQARAELMREGAGELLARLIGRYLGDSNAELSAWLMARADEEYALRLTPAWISAWDYSARMSPPGG